MDNSVVITLMSIVLGSSVLCSIIAIVGNVITFKLQRSAKKSDEKELEEDKIRLIDEQVKQLDKLVSEIHTSMKDVKDGQRTILYDRILYLGKSFINRGEVAYQDKVNLSRMHSVYHNQLGGNGDLDKLMQDIDELCEVKYN